MRFKSKKSSIIKILSFVAGFLYAVNCGLDTYRLYNSSDYQRMRREFADIVASKHKVLPVDLGTDVIGLDYDGKITDFNHGKLNEFLRNHQAINIPGGWDAKNGGDKPEPSYGVSACVGPAYKLFDWIF